jgi:hypothetical protein
MSLDVMAWVRLTSDRASAVGADGGGKVSRSLALSAEKSFV